MVLLSREVRTGAPRIAVAERGHRRGRRVPDRGAGGALADAPGRVPADADRRRCCAARGRCGCACRRGSRSARGGPVRGGSGCRGGCVGGAVPARGKVVELQGYEGGRWREFRTIRSRADGRFAATYRFRAASAGPQLPRARAGPDRSELSVRHRLLAGGQSPRAMSARATCRRWTRWPRRSRRRARWPSPRRGRCWPSGARSCSRARGRRRSRRPRAGVGRGGRAPLAAPGAERDRRDRAHEPRARAAGGGGARGGGGGRGRLLEPRAGPVDGRARVAARARRGAAVRADRGGGGVRGQQRRGRGAAGGGRAGRARPRGRRLARAAGRDRRRLPRARRDRAGGRAAGRGRDDEPHAARRLPGRARGRTRAPSCACTSRTSASSGSSRRCRSRRCASSACR